MNIIILGTGGCRKTSFTGRFGKYLKRNHYKVKFLNLDPGVVSFDYKADYDIRDKFNVKKIMDEENLGPNGAMIQTMEKVVHKKKVDYISFSIFGSKSLIKKYWHLLKFAGNEILECADINFE